MLAMLPERTSRLLAVAVSMLIAVAPAGARAQGTCSVPNGAGNCVIADNATQAANITITRAVLMSLSASSVALASPVSADYIAGFGQTTGPSLTAKANTGWNVAIRATQATWTASPAPARANKPTADLQWGVAAAGPFNDLTTTNVTVQSGVATAGTVIPLYFRVKYAWTLDTPGTYSLPLQLTITAP
jgi:hypothetical protein